MSDNLNELLRQYAIESGEIPNDDPSSMGAEELTVITDDTRSELEEAVADLADHVEKLDNSNAAAEKIIAATESLESHVAQLRGLIDAGVKIEAPAVGFFLQGLRESFEARQIPKALFDETFASMQISFEADEKAGGEADGAGAKEAAEKGDGLIRRLINMLKAAAEATVKFFKGFIERLRGGSKAVKSASAKLSDIATNLKGEPEGKLKGSSHKALVVGDKVDAAGALDKAIEGYNNHLKGAGGNLRKWLNGANAALGSASISAASVKASLENASKALPANFTIELAGGASAVYTKDQAELKGSFSIKKGEVKAPEEIDPLSKAEITALGTKLDSIADIMEDAAKTSEETLGECEKIVKQAEDWGKKQADADAIKEIVKAAKGAISTARLFVPTYMGYVGDLSKAAYNLGTASAAKHKAAKDDGADKGAAGDGKKDGE